MDFRVRQQKLREHLATTRFDGLLVSHLPNIRYLCGFTGSAGLLVVEPGGSVFFTDVRYDIQAHQEVRSAKVVVVRKAPLAALGDFFAKRRKRPRGLTIGVESEHFTVSEKKRLGQLTPSGVRLKDAPSIVERFRMVKDQQEIVLIKDAVELGAKIFNRGLEVLRPGVKEVEVAAEMEFGCPPWRGRGDVVSYDHRLRSAVGAASRACFHAADPLRRVRCLRLRCYTLRLLFGSDSHCVGWISAKGRTPIV